MHHGFLKVLPRNSTRDRHDLQEKDIFIHMRLVKITRVLHENNTDNDQIPGQSPVV